MGARIRSALLSPVFEPECTEEIAGQWTIQNQEYKNE